MYLSLLKYLVCPVCKQDSLKEVSIQKTKYEIIDGTLLCSSCKQWYIIEEKILELIKPELNHERRDAFFKKHQSFFKKLKVKNEHNHVESKELHDKLHQSHHHDHFSENYVLETQNFWRAYYAKNLQKFKSMIPQNALILDLGCGNGLGTAPFLPYNYTIIGIDLSRGMVKDAIQRSEKATNKENHFIIADAENLPFKNKIFDAGIGFGILHHVTNPEITLQNVARTLKIGGQYFGHENNKTILRPIFDLTMKIRKLWHEEAGDHQLFSRKELKEACEASGLKLRADTYVFLPIHFFNSLSLPLAKKALNISDTLFRSIPLVRNQGGAIVFSAKKIID